MSLSPSLSSTSLKQHRLILLTAIAMIAFAANSVLCRVALRGNAIDPMSFTLIRLASGALMLWLILRFSAKSDKAKGNWKGATSLFLYALAFSYAYVQLEAGTGALLLFGAVQLTMVGHGLLKGERMSASGIAGLMVALAGLIALLLPGASAPPVISSILMITSGVAWGLYSILGKGSSNPLSTTTGNFLLSLPLIVFAALPFSAAFHMKASGLIASIASGAIASGVGYAIWYAVMTQLSSFRAAAVQLSVPVLAAIAGLMFLDESLSLRLAIASLAVIGGIVLVLTSKHSQGISASS